MMKVDFLAGCVILAFMYVSVSSKDAKSHGHNPADEKSFKKMAEDMRHNQSIPKGTDPKDLSNGFDKRIKWISLKQALIDAKTNRKPIMLIIHEFGCPASGALKGLIADSEEAIAMSKQLNMVNTVETMSGKYAPDGAYLPRILFLEPNGEVRTDIYNTDQIDEKYYYYYTPTIVASMHHAITGEKPVEPPPPPPPVDAKEEGKEQEKSAKTEDAQTKKSYRTEEL